MQRIQRWVAWGLFFCSQLNPHLHARFQPAAVVSSSRPENGSSGSLDSGGRGRTVGVTLRLANTQAEASDEQEPVFSI